LLKVSIALDNRLGSWEDVPMTTTETYADGTVRPECMAQLPNWALREFLGRHAGPALESAKVEAIYRGWEL
jgi:hypothetical protein